MNEADAAILLNNLKNLGFNPKNILDIGAYHGWWSQEASSVFSEANMTMVEPIKYKELERLAVDRNFNLRSILLYQDVREVNWYEMQNNGDSIFKELTYYFKDCAPSKKMTTTLDIEYSQKTIPPSELVKIDCQGAEISILKGGENIIKQSEIIILEMPFFGKYNKGAPSFAEYISYMDSIGFEPFDIAEYHRHENVILQVDFAFIRKNHILYLEYQNKIVNLGKKHGFV
jgi:FkbM family methyltransferase